MKVFGIGLSKTGTTTLAKALSILGYKSVHAWKQSQLHTYEAATDVPAAVRYRELDERYAGAKFILTVRHLPSWLESCRRMWQARDLFNMVLLPSAAVEYTYCRMKLYGMMEYDRDLFEQAYNRHVREVREHFKDRPNDFLELDICAGEGWEKLCPFLGKPVPRKPFPWRNRARRASPPALPRKEAV